MNLKQYLARLDEQKADVARLCATCDRARRLHGQTTCSAGLLPTTTTGEDCPYYKLRTGGRRDSGCTHDGRSLWLVGDYVSCGVCHVLLNRDIYRSVARRAEAFDPKLHCGNWKLGDDRTKYHGAACKKPSSKVVAFPAVLGSDRVS